MHKKIKILLIFLAPIGIFIGNAHAQPSNLQIQEIDPLAGRTEIVKYHPKTIPLQLSVLGKTAIMEGKDYFFQVYNSEILKGKGNGIVEVTLTNDFGEEVYKEKSILKNGLFIPGTYLKQGDYTLILRTKYYDEQYLVIDENVSQKKLGVVASDKDWLDRNRIPFFIVFGIILFLAILYHFLYDHVYLKKIRQKNRLFGIDSKGYTKNGTAFYKEIKIKHKK